MFSGAQFSLYPMTADFVPAILRGIGALDRYGASIRRETDDLSTLLVGPPATVVRALGDAFVATASGGGHVVLAATLSRGCPGESDDPICRAPALPAPAPGHDAAAEALARFVVPAPSGIAAAAQIALYPLGTEAHMARIGACIEFLKRAGVFLRSKNFCTKLAGDAAVLFAAVERCFLDFAPAEAHLVLTLTVSAGSPSSTGRE
jgi:uncharacterized protein YqgV (UPF0045/DUF77 family)